MLTPQQQQELINAAKMLDPMCLWSGSLDEFTPVPTPSTYSFILEKLNNQNIIQNVMTMTTMPLYLPNEQFIINILDHSYINLQFEKQLYLNGAEVYFDVTNPHARPEMRLKWNLMSFLPNAIIFMRQALWVLDFVFSNKHKKVGTAIDAQVTKVAAHIAGVNDLATIEADVDQMITCTLATELIDNLLEQYLREEVKPKYLFSWDIIEAYYWQRYRPNDLYFQSMYQIDSVTAGNITQEQYMQQFGFRGLVDFELNSPRYAEIPATIFGKISRDHQQVVAEKLINIAAIKNIHPLDKKMLEAAWEIKSLRGTVRLKSMIGIAKLRAYLLRVAKEQTISGDLIFFMTKEEILKDPKLFVDQAAERKAVYEQNMKLSLPPLLLRDTVLRLTALHLKGERALGTPVCGGVVLGPIQYVKSAAIDPKDLENKICVFADASPEFSMLYRHAKGLVFETGGAMSHGAIVAREYRIPAISLGGHPLEWEANIQVQLNGNDGTVRIV